ncbi:TetR/AcrR family transcriptional regulator [Roseovarius spongiae]|uniref:TetR/AcrR family transcriptional regulator n=1 Tax=Roseovarius spongiae TaxID=2320272 RepID=A0A3A8B7U6_9RHOB|nr:TetR/AcrR family transcriptional regulator [Roseovarius spongiae]RKF12997.1 TetR/AcrR family transcriptional regulator [Roseovarius spongiae]
MPTPPLSPLKAARWQKILDAAEAVFVARGFRGATMEGIAEAAGVSKATLYGYAPDKDAVFAAAADRVAERLQHAVESALAGDGPAPTRIAAALIAKHRIIDELVRRSPFADDLFAEKTRTSSGRFAALDRAIEAEIAAELRVGGSKAGEASRLAALLFNASQGIANGGAEFDSVAQDIRRLVQALVPG